MTTMKNINVKFLREPRKVVLAFAVTLVLLTVCVENTLAAKRPASPTPSSQNKRAKLMEPAFVNAGQTAGLEIWRVEVIIRPENAFSNTKNINLLAIIF